jgi:hypothetical protein
MRASAHSMVRTYCILSYVSMYMSPTKKAVIVDVVDVNNVI